MVGMVANHTSAGHGDSLSMACFSQTQPVFFSIKKQNGKTHTSRLLFFFHLWKQSQTVFTFCQAFQTKGCSTRLRRTSVCRRSQADQLVCTRAPPCLVTNCASCGCSVQDQKFSMRESNQASSPDSCHVSALPSTVPLEAKSCAWKHCNTRNNSCEHM